MRPENTEYPGYYEPYIGLTKTADIVNELSAEGEKLFYFISSIPEEKGNYCYADGKWSIKQVLAHIIDTERIFSYRALCFSRNEEQSLPGFDENTYAKHDGTESRSIESLAIEFRAVREASIQLYKNCTNEQMLRSGFANEKRLTVRAIAHITCGHAEHHAMILKERYL